MPFEYKYPYTPILCIERMYACTLFQQEQQVPRGRLVGKDRWRMRFPCEPYLPGWIIMALETCAGLVRDGWVGGSDRGKGYGRFPTIRNTSIQARPWKGLTSDLLLLPMRCAVLHSCIAAQSGGTVCSYRADRVVLVGFASSGSIVSLP